MNYLKKMIALINLTLGIVIGMVSSNLVHAENTTNEEPEAKLDVYEISIPKYGSNTGGANVHITELKNLGQFKLTAYCACSKCCGKSDGITYSGTKATQGRTIAVDPKVIPLGTKVYINGHEYIAEDIGGAINSYHIDVYFDDHSEALKFGVQYADVCVEMEE